MIFFFFLGGGGGAGRFFQKNFQDLIFPEKNIQDRVKILLYALNYFVALLYPVSDTNTPMQIMLDSHLILNNDK